MSNLVEIGVDKSFLMQIGNFLLLLFLLNTFLFRPIIRFVENRHGTIQGNREEAERKEAEARELLEGYLEGIAKANRDAAEALAAVRREAELTQRDMLEEARRQAERMISEAVDEIKETAETARAGLREEVGKISRDITQKLLGRTLA
jgi:F-type H+-transporting ATPase subunit b